MKRIGLVFLVFVMAISACTPQPTELAKQAQASALALDSLHGNVAECNSMDVPCHDLDAGGYFKALPRLSMREGYILDYIIHQDGMGSYPIFYVRAADQPAFADEAAYAQAESEGKLLPGGVTDYVEIEDTPQGYLDFTIFNLLSGQFYLGWHANYFDTTIVATPEQLEDLLASQGFGMEIPKDIAEAARKLDLNPSVTMGEKDVTVSLVLFTKWGGFYRYTVKYDRASPHKLLDSNSETLVEYDCGIMF